MAAAPATFDAAWTGAWLATMTGDGLGLIDDAVLAVRDGRIAWIGARCDFPAGAVVGETHALEGALVTPGLIDCHTHLVFAGDRAREFERRLAGESYEQIARAGGGIMSTVRATRDASDEDLYEAGAHRLKLLMAEGVTSVEIKSGYGLNVNDEMKMLRVARRLGETLPVSITTTFLGAHALPPEFVRRQSEYVDYLCEFALPALVRQELVDAVDAFCEKIAFTREEVRRLFECARRHGLPVKLHAEQLSDQRGAQLAAEFNALSADHLEFLSQDGIDAMARSGVVAVLLPAAFYTMRETKLPPVAGLRAARVPMAVASDLNPGTAPVPSLQAAMNMACTLFGLTVAEVLRGVTINAARALGFRDRGQLAPGMRADFCVWEVGAPAELCYWLGGMKPNRTFIGGVERHG